MQIFLSYDPDRSLPEIFLFHERPYPSPIWPANFKSGFGLSLVGFVGCFL
jgi:hypothetical protein